MWNLQKPKNVTTGSTIWMLTKNILIHMYRKSNIKLIKLDGLECLCQSKFVQFAIKRLDVSWKLKIILDSIWLWRYYICRCPHKLYGKKKQLRPTAHYVAVMVLVKLFLISPVFQGMSEPHLEAILDFKYEKSFRYDSQSLKYQM